MKKIILSGAILGWCFAVNAQTYHFSQFYSAPLLINPAATGSTAGPYRLAANYRSQWDAGSSPYTTFTFSGDAHILQNKLTDGNKLGVGLVIMNDKTIGGAVQTNNLGVSAGYHVSLDEDNIQSIGVGFQGTYNEKRIDYSRLQFENQFGNGEFDPSLPIGESLGDGKKYFVDFNAGLMYSFSLEDRSFFAGVAGYNLLKKEDNFLTEQFKTPRLLSVVGGADIDVGNNHSFYFSGNYRQQSNNQEVTLGFAYGVFIDQTGYYALKVGLWHRINDALIPYAGLSYKGLQVGCSFDYMISSKKSQSQFRNTFEVSVLYLAPDLSELKRMIPWY